MAAIRLLASFVLIPEQAAVKYSRYEASREAVNASASPGVNSTSLQSFTRTLATSSCGVPQQSLYFFPDPQVHGSLRPVLLLIVPSGPELYPSHNAKRTISATVIAPVGEIMADRAGISEMRYERRWHSLQTSLSKASLPSSGFVCCAQRRSMYSLSVICQDSSFIPSPSPSLFEEAFPFHPLWPS